MIRYVRFLVLAALILVSAGCEQVRDAFRGVADFQVSVSNRTTHRLTFFANGVAQGEVPAGQAQLFEVELKTVSQTGPTAPSSQAQATFAARDMVTGKLSQSKPAYLTQDRPANVEFTASDFQ